MPIRKFKNRERVTVHSLGDDKLYRGYVVGIALQHATVTFYLVRMVDSFRPTYEYDCVLMADGCLRIGWPGTKRYLGGMMLGKLEK